MRSGTSIAAPAVAVADRSSDGARLVTDGITVDFGGLRALDQVSLVVQSGEIVSLIGPNGAGKTTLFNAISGFVTPTTGAVVFEGVDISGQSPTERARRGIVRTFQRMELFEELSVLENLIVSRELERPLRLLRGAWQGRGADHADRADAEERLAFLGLYQHRHRQVSSLPSGLRRLVELGRVLMVDATMILLDEPSSGLDHTETERFNEIILDLRNDRPEVAILLVEHDMTVALTLADHVYVLDFGQLLCHGQPDEIRADPRVRAAYLGEEG
jgi:branched-chain amino acid transport system ATP-binding protein